MKSKFILILLIIFCYLNSAVKETDTGIEFSFEDPHAQSIFIAGSINEWNTTSDPLQKDEDGVWKIVLQLPEGKYSYKFIVDGNWLFDQDNPDVEDDGYGGSNSVVEVRSSGIVPKEKKKDEGVKSTMNPKVFFTGRFISNNIFVRNENDRFMLEKPVNDLDFGIKVKLNQNFDVFTLLNVNNTKEDVDIYKTHFKYKKAYLKLKIDLFELIAFDDHGTITFDDPLHLMGDDGIYHYDFGYGYRGFYGKTKRFGIPKLKDIFDHNFTGEFVYSDQIGESEADINAARLKFSSLLKKREHKTIRLDLGSSLYKYTDKLSEDITQSHTSYEFDGGISKTLSQTGWRDAMKVDFMGEYYAFENSDRDSTDHVWMDGNTIFVGFDVQFPQALKLATGFKKSRINFTAAKQDISRNTINMGADLSIGNFSFNIEEKLKITAYPDSNVSWADYYNFLERTDCNGRWFQLYDDISFSEFTLLGYEKASLLTMKLDYYADIFGKKIAASYSGDIAQHSLFYEPKFVESVLELQFYLTNNWIISTNTRIPYYNDEFLGLKTDFSNNEDFFVSNYSQIVYRISDNVKLELGYGVKPTVINEVTNEYYDEGRNEFMLNTVGSYEIENGYSALGEKIRTAEKALQNEQRITLEAVMQF